MTGKKLKHYQIEELLGSGGMGEVYKARDTKLDRPVAIKVLRAEFLAQESRRQRFIQEARAASALNHPNIVTIHDIDREDGIDFMVMEYIAGRTLDAVLPRIGLPITETLRIAVQIAEGLRRAHSAGIVHRDVKPSNVMVSTEGQVKILDFGLAKQTGEPKTREDDETRTARAETEVGTVMGTVTYMSPEQAEGRKLDARTDIFSFGAVLYEMLSGRKAFEGESKLSTMAAILKEEPKPLVNVPPDLDKAIRRCLRKDSDRRYQHMDDVKIALEEMREESGSGRQAPAAPRANRKWWIVAAALAAVAAGSGVAWRVRIGATSATATQSLRVTRLTRDAGLTTHPAVSPDGQLVAYSSDRAGEGHRDIWVQQLGGGQAMRLTKDAGDEDYPSFSPDGTHIAYSSMADGGAIYSISTLGGDARLLTRTARPLNTKYSPDGKWIAFDTMGWTGNAMRVQLVPAAGGAPRALETGLERSLFAAWSPDGRSLLVSVPGVEQGSPNFYLVPAEGEKARPVLLAEALKAQRLRPAGPPNWDREGLVMPLASGDQTGLYRLPFDAASQRVGDPKLLVSVTGTQLQPAVGPSGPLVYATIQARQRVYSIPIDINRGKVTGAPELLTNDDADNISPTLSADGSRMAFVSSRSGKPQLWWRDMKTGKDSHVPSEPVNRANISPDGSKIAFELAPAESGVRLVDIRTGDAKHVCDKCSVQKWLPDGSRVMYYVRDPSLRFLLHDPKTAKDTIFAASPIRGVNWFRFSDDMKWVSFHTIQKGRTRIHVAPYGGGEFPGEDKWIPIFDDEALGHHYSWWSPDANLLYFVSGRIPETAVLAQPLDPATKRPRGEKFEVFRAPSGHAFLGVRVVGLAMAPGRMVVAMSDSKGNLWKAEPGDEPPR